MRFLRDWISFISPRSHLAVALATRVAAIEVLENPFELDRVPLLRGNAERFELVPFDRYGEHSRFLASKSKIIDGPAGGEIVRVSDRALFLLGIREELLVIAAEQDFERLLTYKAPTGTVDKVVDCSLSRSRARTIDLPAYVEEGQRRLQTVRFRARGSIQYSPGGLVFGVIPMEAIAGSGEEGR